MKKQFSGSLREGKIFFSGIFFLWQFCSPAIFYHGQDIVVQRFHLYMISRGWKSNFRAVRERGSIGKRAMWAKIRFLTHTLPPPLPLPSFQLIRLLSDFLRKFGGKLKFGVKVNVRKGLFDEPPAFCHLTRATRQKGGRSIELQVAPLQTDKKYPWTIRMKKYIKMHYRNEERSMKAIVVEAKSIARRTIANEKGIRTRWC